MRLTFTLSFTSSLFVAMDKKNRYPVLPKDPWARPNLDFFLVGAAVRPAQAFRGRSGDENRPRTLLFPFRVS